MRIVVGAGVDARIATDQGHVHEFPGVDIFKLVGKVHTQAVAAALINMLSKHSLSRALNLICPGDRSC